MSAGRILVTGVTGQVAEWVATALARSPADDASTSEGGAPEVVGLARFTDDAARQRLEAAGVRCVEVDLASGKGCADLPGDVDALLNFAVVKSGRWELDLRANAEGIGLLMAQVRPRRMLHCSSTGVYAPAGSAVLDESAPLGDNHRAIMPTYSIAKIAAEEVVRTMCRHLEVPTTIARLNVPYGVGPDGTARGWPAFHAAMIGEGMAIPVHPDRPNLFDPIDLRDIAAMVPALIDAATVPATIVNWAGPEQVSLEQWCALLGEVTGSDVSFEETEATIGGVTVDTTKLRSIVGEDVWKHTVGWRDGMERLARAAVH